MRLPHPSPIYEFLASWGQKLLDHGQGARVALCRYDFRSRFAFQFLRLLVSCIANLDAANCELLGGEGIRVTD